MSEKPNRYVDRFRCSTHIYYEGLEPCPECAEEATAVDRLTAELAEAKADLQKYEGAVEVEGFVNANGDVIVYGNSKTPQLASNDVTVWVKRREG